MKSHIRIGIGVCLLALLEAACSEHLPVVRDGDLIFQTSRSSQSLAIQRATGSPYSHMGLIFLRDSQPYVLEAVATVRFTPLDRWIARGAGHHFVVKRLRNADTVLDPGGINRLRTAALRFAGRPYDLTEIPVENRRRGTSGNTVSTSVQHRHFALGTFYSHPVPQQFPQ